MHTLTALSDQFRRGLFLFLKNIFPKWVYDSGFSVGTSEGVKPSLFLDNRIYSQDTIPVKSANPIFAHWCFLPLFATIYAKGGESHEENHHPAAGASDERVFSGKAVGNLVKYAN